MGKVRPQSLIEENPPDRILLREDIGIITDATVGSEDQQELHPDTAPPVAH